jgi:hypothetical protein
MTPCSDVVGYQRFGGLCYCHLQGGAIGAFIKIQVVVFRVMIPCSDVVGYQSSEGPCCLLLQGEVRGPSSGHIITEGESVNQSVTSSYRRTPFGAHDQILNCSRLELDIGIDSGSRSGGHNCEPRRR